MFKAEELLAEHRANRQVYEAEVLNFVGVDGYDVYNISAPFLLHGQLILAGRVEARENEQSWIGLFTLNEKQEWQLIEEAVRLELQDPFVTVIEGKVILGGVEVVWQGSKALKWRTDFYELKSVTEAKFIFSGPWGMKDIRLKELSDKRILVLTRPQGEKAGLGKIGLLLVDSLTDLTAEKLAAAPLLKNQYDDSEWGGANEIHELNGQIHVLGHIGRKDSAGNLHYRALEFELSHDLTELANPRIVAERCDFIDGPAKRADLHDVVFSGGLILDGDKAILYAGTSDAQAQRLKIVNPFI